MSALNDLIVKLIQKLNTSVKTESMALTEGQKAQARQNIGVEPLIGSTNEITPAQVAVAVVAGRDVVIAHTSETFGTTIYTFFAINEAMGFIFAATAFELYGSVLLGQLVGFLNSGIWDFVSMDLAKASDIPTIPTALKNPYALTFTGAVSGTYDGSSAKTINIPTIAGTPGKDGVGITNITIAEV